MENLSKMTIDDSSTSMYFSFNSTSANKTVEAMESGAEISCMTEEEEDAGAEQNNTLEAGENYDAAEEEIQTVKKLSFGVSPVKAIPKNILKAYKALSSTPTKAQLLRSVEVTRGSAAVDVCDLGLAFLEAPQECINSVLSEDKENQPQESQEIYSETSSEIVVSVIEKTQEEVKPIEKRVGFSNLPVLKGTSGNSNLRYTPKVRRSVQRCEPDLVANRPSRIAPKRMSIHAKVFNQPTKEYTADEIPKMISSMLKISKDLPTKRKSIGNPEKPFNLLGKATRMSIVKTTLNSPARKVSRKSITAQGGRIPTQASAPLNKRKSFAPDGLGAPRRSFMPLNSRASTLSNNITSPKKRTLPLSSRKSMIPEKLKTTTLIPTSRRSMAPQPSTSANPEPHETYSKLLKAKKAPSGLKEEYVCEVCTRKFRVLSLFETHKRSHNAASSSARQAFFGNDKQCRYCDKKFAIAKALDNHLLQNCTKIPPGDKKKLLFPSSQPSQSSTTHHNSKTLQKSISNLSSDSYSSNTTQLTHSQIEAKNSDTGNGTMLPPSIHKIKKKLAHSGVYCTPNKEIPCHVCKISFTSILAYTEHSLSHSTALNEDAAGSTANESTQTHSKGVSPYQEDGIAPLN